MLKFKTVETVNSFVCFVLSSFSSSGKPCSCKATEASQALLVFMA